MKITKNLKKLFIIAGALLVLLTNISQAKHKSKNIESNEENKNNLQESFLSAADGPKNKKNEAAIKKKIPARVATSLIPAPAKKAKPVPKASAALFGKPAKAPAKKGIRNFF